MECSETEIKAEIDLPALVAEALESIPVDLDPSEWNCLDQPIPLPSSESDSSQRMVVAKKTVSILGRRFDVPDYYLTILFDRNGQPALSFSRIIDEYEIEDQIGCPPDHRSEFTTQAELKRFRTFAIGTVAVVILMQLGYLLWNLKEENAPQNNSAPKPVQRNK